MIEIFQKGIFTFRFRFYRKLVSKIYKYFYKISGMEIGNETDLPTIKVNWPHQVSIGKSCKIEHAVSFKFDGVWKKGPSIILKNNVFVGSGCEFNIRKRIIIDDNSLIASGCKFIDHDHGVSLAELIRVQKGPEEEIVINSDVWLGCNVVVLKGVVIGAGAVVAAGAVVTKSIPSYEIWGGVPARKIGVRN